MLIGSKQKLNHVDQLTLQINGTKLENVTVQKVLGVLIDSNLNWHSQIDAVCKKLNAKIALLKHILYYLTDEVKLLFFNAYLLPIFDYCCTLWGKDNNTYINKVYVLQKRAAKIILNKPMRTPTAGLYKQLNWLTFSDRCKYHSAILVYKTMNHMAPSYMTDVITFATNEKYNLRSAMHNDLVLKFRPQTNYLKDSFAYYSRTVWNNIPFEIKNAKSVHSFKRLYRKYLMNSY